MSTSCVEHRRRPDLSFVMPCYNEEAIVGYTISKLMGAFAKSGYVLELEIGRAHV